MFIKSKSSTYSQNKTVHFCFYNNGKNSSLTKDYSKKKFFCCQEYGAKGVLTFF